MIDGHAFRTGWDQAVWLLSYLYGALLPLLVVAALFALGWYSTPLLNHWRRVRRLRRDARRSGRTTR